MNSETKFGVAVGNNLFTYPMIGFGTFLIYEKDKSIISVNDLESGRTLLERELEKRMDYDQFISYAKNMFLCSVNHYLN